ncbi:hypothetical protein G6Z25_01900 [Clostridium perfringens]|uniref:hypothetical protein n=1 Tax=Clostridium perfringens TaxID=1502 RepID=UPI0013E370BA|nr:hypothetical protein [Clostridium perfringens]NGS95671.1 hypothetical protein [Clostridium perfringens]
MNKRIEKIVLKAKESKNNLTTPRRDQIKKAVEEKAFDYMIYKGYDEIYDVEPVRMAAVLENIENYWLTDGSMWASVNDDVLKVTIKYGYSYLTLYADLKEDEEQSLNNVESEEVEITYNEEKNGIEVKFNTKPAQEVINDLKANGFRWHRVKKVWYAKQTDERVHYINTTFEINQINDEKEVNNIIELNDYRNESEDIKDIIINPDVVEVKEQDQYFIKSVKFANLNKRNTIKEYEKEIVKGDYLFQDVKITRELYFNNIEELESFNNSLMLDFDFINGTGGSCTDDERINDIKDYWNMSDKERDTVKWYLKGIAVYFNNELQYIIDAQGYSYARYVGLVCEYTKNEKKVLEAVKEEKIEMEMNFDDILESFENVEIKNENRLCEEDLNFLEDLQEKFNNAKVGFEKYIEFYRENKICNLEEKEIKISCDSLEEYFVNKVVFIEGKSFISKIYNYFEKKYNITLERIKINDDYSLDFREKEAKQNLKWFMETLDYNLVLDDIFNQLNGISFKDREKEELKREFEYSKPVIKGNSINLKNAIYFNDISLKYNNNYEISYNSRGKFRTIFKLIDIINKNNNEDLCDNIIFEKNEVIGIHELKGEIIKSIQVFKNGSIKLTCDTGLNALNIAKEYLNYKEVA